MEKSNLGSFIDGVTLKPRQLESIKAPKPPNRSSQAPAQARPRLSPQRLPTWSKRKTSTPLDPRPHFLQGSRKEHARIAFHLHPETTTVFRFPDRGDWATHFGNCSGNWSPYIPRNFILRYTAPGDIVLDQMAGSGTTLVECKLLGRRRAVGVDINPDAVMVARNRLDFAYTPLDAEHEAVVDRNCSITIITE